MRVSVDGDVCQGHLRCTGFAPTVFQVDQFGHAHTNDEKLGPALEEGVRMAALNCPERAISFTDE